VRERGEYLRIALRASEPLGIAGKHVRQHFERDVSLQPRIAGAVDFAHAAGAEQGGHLIDADTRAGREGHG
jgi:hypothetical protein